MKLTVETQAVPFREEEPRAFWLGNQRIAVIEIVDRWLAPEYGYFKVAGDDGASYILRHDLPSDEWELTLFAVPGEAATTLDGAVRTGFSGSA